MQKYLKFQEPVFEEGKLILRFSVNPLFESEIRKELGDKLFELTEDYVFSYEQKQECIEVADISGKSFVFIIHASKKTESDKESDRINYFINHLTT